MDFAANRLQMQQKSAEKPKGLPRGRSFLKAQSGNPGGKRPGTRNRATIIAEEMLDCETRPLLRGAIENAKGGDGVMARFCLSRIIGPRRERPDRKSTRLNSSHRCISYAVFCLKKKKTVLARSN